MGGGLATLIRDNIDFDEEDRKLVVLVSELLSWHFRFTGNNLIILFLESNSVMD